MEPLNSGIKWSLRARDGGWVQWEEMVLVEGTTYDWKYTLSSSEQVPAFSFCDVPLFPSRVVDGEACGQLTTPFYSGQAYLTINGNQHETFIYPDERKLTQTQYDLMISDILREASLCFAYSSIETGIDADQLSRELTLAQWSYIEASFGSLSSIVRFLMERPTRVLQVKDQRIRRERVKLVDTRTMTWLERHRGRSADGIMPEIIQSSIREDSYNTYENRLLKRWLIDLRQLLHLYRDAVPKPQSSRATVYGDKIGYWLRAPFFKQVTAYEGTVHISQVHRKHPVYRQCYQWFERLYKHGAERIGLQYRYPLRETYTLYEIWCYMQVIRVFRERDMLEDSSGLFVTTKTGVFLDFAKNKESVVKLKRGMRLSYQREINRRSKPFYSYTQTMKPDIVIESGERLYILDPKYRVATNLGTALGEMHKYKDGILLYEDDRRGVQQVFIVTPVQDVELDFFSPQYHSRYDMGAISLAPGADPAELERWISGVLNKEFDLQSKHQEGCSNSLHKQKLL